VGELAFLGFHFQNWMLLALAILVLAVLYPWIRGLFRHPD